MTKKEKFSAILIIISMLLIIISSIYTIIKNKPQGSSFALERMIINHQSKMFFKNDIR